MRLRLSALLLLPLLVAGCASGPSAIVDTFRTSLESRRAADAASLDPKFRYLRITIDGRVALLVLGNVETDPAGPIEVWYSAQREVIRLQNGRLQGAVGLTAEWREVREPRLPSWQTLINQRTPLTHTRHRDVMPGYHFGVEDRLTLRTIPPPSGTALSGIAADSLIWFEERMSHSGSVWREAPVHLDLPPARYAIDPRAPEVVIYGEQCLTRTLCFTWQHWPPMRGAAS